MVQRSGTEYLSSGAFREIVIFGSNFQVRVTTVFVIGSWFVRFMFSRMHQRLKVQTEEYGRYQTIVSVKLYKYK